MYQSVLLGLVCLNVFFTNSSAQNSTNNRQNTFSPVELLSASNVTNYTLKDGLISNYVYAINQDSLGYIWIATQAGLSRFNGDEFHNFTTKNGLKKNETVQLVKTKLNRIWMYNNGPMGYIENGSIHFLDNDIKQDLHWNFSVTENSDSLWTAFSTKFYLVNKSSGVSKEFYKPGFCGTGRCTILGRHNDQLVIHVKNKIYYFKNETIVDSISWTHRNSLNYQLLSTNYKNGVFYAYKNGLFYLNFSTKKIRQYSIEIEEPTRLKCFGNKLILISLNGELATFHIDKELEIEEEEKTITKIAFTDIFKDKDSNFWVGTNTHGVFFVPKESKQIKTVSSLNGIHFSALNCMYITGDSIWLGTKNAELILLHNKATDIKVLPFKNPNGGSRIIDILKLESGRLLLSSDAGLFLLDGQDLKHITYGAIKKISRTNNEIYINTYTGILKTNEDCLDNLLTSIKPTDGLEKQIETICKKNACFKKISEIRSYKTQIINKNNLFVYEPKYGFVNYTIFNDELINRIVIKENIDINDLYYFEPYIFIATTGEGILNYNIDTKELKPFKSINSSTVYSLDIDADSNTMCAGTNNGLHIIKLNSEGLDENVITISQNQGLLSAEITQALFTDTNIVAISDKGINFVQKSFHKNHVFPNFNIEQFLVNNESQILERSYELQPNENNITIAYNKIDFNKTIKSQFAYKMNNNKWMYTNNKSLSFVDLEPGKHNVKLGLVNERNKIPQKFKELKFNIQPKFHQTKWAKLIFSLIFLVFTFLIINYFLAQKNLKTLERKVVERTQLLQLKMKELDEVNLKLKLKNTNLNSYTYLVSHDLKTPLHNITGFLNIITKKNEHAFDKKDKEYFRMVNQGLNSMMAKITDLLKYSKVSTEVNLNEIEPINLNEIINEIIKDFKFEIDKRKVNIVVEENLPEVKLEKTSAQLLFQNLISNSIKYNVSLAPFIEITSQENLEQTIIEIKDNGIGISKDYQCEVFDIFNRGTHSAQYEGTGVGLAICKKIVEAHHGNIKLKSKKNVGSVFSLVFPNSEPIV